MTWKPSDPVWPPPEREIRREPYEQPGPSPRRHLTPEGRALLVWGVIALAFLALSVLVLVPTRFGVYGG